MKQRKDAFNLRGPVLVTRRYAWLALLLLWAATWSASSWAACHPGHCIAPRLDCAALLSAVEAGDSQALAVALAAGESPSCRLERRDSVLEAAGLPSLHSTPAVVIAAKGSSDVMSMLLEAGADPNDPMEPGRVTALSVSAAHANLPVMEVLMRWGADPNAVPLSGVTPVEISAMLGFVDGTRFLLRNGADPNDYHTIPVSEWRTFSRCPTNHIAQKLIADYVRRREVVGESYVGIGVQDLIWDFQMGTLKNALDLGLLEVGRQDQDGWTPLMWAAAGQAGSSDKVQLLLECGSDANASSAQGWTALMSSAATGASDSANVLIKAGANVHAAEATGDETVLHIAVKQGDYEVVQLLLENSANPSAKNALGLTPLQMVAPRELREMERLFAEYASEEGR